MEYLHTNRVIVLVDMDCFYCQVEEKLNPELVGKPIAVVQYNAWRGGGIIAVNYPARDRGVTRHMRGNEARKKCPDIILVSVPTNREKADLTKYRDAGKEVAAVLQNYTELLERASVDEAYMDITDAVNKRLQSNPPVEVDHDQLNNTHVVGCDIKDFVVNVRNNHVLESNLKLCIGGIIAEEIRADVFNKTGYRCSAGIAHNKVLAKLACGMHKPNQQTILPQDAVDELYTTLPLRKIRSLGGKFGEELNDDLNIKTMAELKKFSEKELINKYDDKTGSWLYKIARGIDLEPVIVRLVSKSIGCCKKFPGRTALTCPEDVNHWINELSMEISERLNKDMNENNRKAKHMIVGFVQEVNGKDISASRTHPLISYEIEKIAADMLKVIIKQCLNVYGSYRIKYLGISAGKFEDCKKGYDIISYFKNIKKITDVSHLKSDCDTSFKVKDCTIQGSKCFDSNSDLEVNESRKLPYTHFNENDNLNSIEAEDSDSIYSADTIILEIDENDLEYNENYKSIDEFHSNSPETHEIHEDSEDSISNEIITSQKGMNDAQNENSQSYFSNYFRDMHCVRNFNTSKNLEYDGVDSSTNSTNSSANIDRHEEEMQLLQSENMREHDTFMDDTFMNVVMTQYTKEDGNDNQSLQLPSCKEISNQLISNNFKFDTVKNESNCTSYNEKQDDIKEKCKECHTLILKSEMMSHMDYHLAIQILRNDTHLYNDQNKTPNVPKKVPEVKQMKRKRNEVESTKLTSFFESSKPIPSDVPTENCPECNKVIVSDEFASHLDYHIAKKLHHEMNPVRTTELRNTNKKAKQGSKQNRTQNITSFFTSNT